MPLSKSSSKPPDKVSSRSLRPPRKKETDPNPAAQVAGPSNGMASTSRRPRQMGRVGNEENRRAPTLPSSNIAQIVPESPALTELLETLSNAAAMNNNSGQDVPIIQIDPPSERRPESTFLAQTIRGLINSLPALSSRFLSPRDVPIVDSDGSPIPPPGAVRIQDPELISLLSNPSIMNGSDGRRQSVWSMLEAIAPPRVGSAQSVDDDYAGSDRSSVMMYSPLIPSADSVIELADLEDAPVAQSSPSSGNWLSTLWPAWSNVWPFTGRTNAAEGQDINPGPPPAIGTPEPDRQPNSLEQRRQTPVHRVWVPSTTQLSFETMWWGYRIYLPPPILDILDDQSVEAATQATTLTAALTWFFSNLPVAAFPPPLQPAMILLQRLVPFVSYIGTFISWSWSTIRGFDRGHGVILTATWLLPIALIPGTWHARDVPPPSAPSSPAPASISTFMLPPDVRTPEVEPELPIPATPVLATIPLPPFSPEEIVPPPPPPPKLRKHSTLGKTKNKTISTLRKLTRLPSS
ncbi:hypothetical protein DFH09DRAFT_1119893 [Mycena vulgaris]|nr:hypothetical protein DFH09DRAFT_1119893 [Mycena vulgaris]